MKKENPAAWYSLRRTLPPWRFGETLADLLELAPRFGIDEPRLGLGGALPVEALRGEGPAVGAGDLLFVESVDDSR